MHAAARSSDLLFLSLGEEKPRLLPGSSFVIDSFHLVEYQRSFSWSHLDHRRIEQIVIGPSFALHPQKPHITVAVNIVQQ
jgi:hypothetical protein